MDNNFSTGNGYFDFSLLFFAWFMAFLDWTSTPVILSCLASITVIIKQGLDMYDKYRQKKQNRRRK